MSKKPQYDPEEIRFPDQKIVNSPLVPEMEKSYIEYAMSVIVSRALPDVRDGLKPVHRRILYAMYEDGLTVDKPFKKSATCVGDVLGRYHPHGDASVYDALVRLAQDFSMRYPLVDGHGNFGSVDGDPPAAYRYTEARLARLSDEMLRDIEKDTVDWDPNFDETRKEPRVLPSRFPNLLVNGSSGIAVGMATNIPPHNMREVINACICVLDNPEAQLSDLMQYIKGPDFPTRGIIMGRSGIRQAYATGRGRVVIRARHEFEEFNKDRTRIVITEIPYQVNKRMLIKNMAEQVEDELTTIVDLGGCVVNVMVNHRVYGKLNAPLNIKSRRDVQSFINDLKTGKSTPLLNVTSGYHFHKINAESEEVLDEIEEALNRKGYLAQLLPYETADAAGE